MWLGSVRATTTAFRLPTEATVPLECQSSCAGRSVEDVHTRMLLQHALTCTVAKAVAVLHGWHLQCMWGEAGPGEEAAVAVLWT